jgi:hypothetical protein
MPQGRDSLQNVAIEYQYLVPTRKRRVQSPTGTAIVSALFQNNQSLFGCRDFSPGTLDDDRFGDWLREDQGKVVMIHDARTPEKTVLHLPTLVPS